MSTLEKIGITSNIIDELRRDGLFIPPRIEPFKNALKTPGGIVYDSDDLFTPPLDNHELDRYIKDPKLFCTVLIERLQFFSKVSGILSRAVNRIEATLNVEESLVASLAILYIFHACGDYNCYKYCKHLDYYDYENSPVGYYYRKLSDFIDVAAERKEEGHSMEWAQRKLLELMSSPLDERIGKVTEYEIICQEIQDKLTMRYQANNLSPEDLLNWLKENDEALYKEVTDKSEYLFKSTTEFLSDCTKTVILRLDLDRRIKNAKGTAQKAYSEIVDALSTAEEKEFDYVLQAVYDFILVHQEETFIFNGVTPAGSNLLYPFIVSYEKLRELIENHPRLLCESSKEITDQFLREENVVLGARKLVQANERILQKDTRELYLQELRRWL